ncbi:MFS transporter (plasmid) [Streptomyces sp. NBC_01724]|uniref:MFS transporter n=1 Tax=Streptomyces sp. NBC_01724 TaxID=2975922 RepID=UPI002E304A4F|nr:MFS transporter [Streptomyces sp. NBC_01724]
MPTTAILTEPPAPVPTPASTRWPPVIWALLAGTFLVRGLGFAYPFLSYRLTELGFSTAIVGQILAAFGCGWLVGQLLCGWLSDRLGRRTTLLGTMVTAALTLPVLAAVQSAAAVLTAAFIAGVVYDAHRPIVSAVIADTLPSESGRALVNGWRHFAVNVGAALTGSLGGLLAGRVGISMLFWFNAAACVAFALIALRFMKPTLASGGAADRPSYRAALADARLWLLSLASLAALTCAAGMFTALPMLMTEDGLDAAAYGWTQVVSAAAVVVLSPVLTPWLSRRALRDTPMLGQLATSSLVLGAGMGAAGLASSTLGYSLAAAIAVPGEIILFIAASDLVNRISPREARGLYAGIWGSTLAIAVIAAPMLAAWSLDNGGDLLAGTTTFTAGLLGAVLCVPLRALLADQFLPPKVPLPVQPSAVPFQT